MLHQLHVSMLTGLENAGFYSVTPYCARELKNNFKRQARQPWQKQLRCVPLTQANINQSGVERGQRGERSNLPRQLPGALRVHFTGLRGRKQAVANSTIREAHRVMTSPSRRSGRAGWRWAAAKHWAEIEEARRSDTGEESPAKQAGARKISHQTS